eukprot:m.255061 g.255061  ORF g.255061 m.255061 type:complete len:110 (-) comp19608_c0_seq23:2075-2404(-)
MSPHASVPAQLLISALLYMYAADPAVSIGQSGLPNTDFFETLISPLSQYVHQKYPGFDLSPIEVDACRSDPSVHVAPGGYVNQIRQDSYYAGSLLCVLDDQHSSYILFS